MRLTMRTRLVWAALACAPALAGCGTRYAIIERRDGSELHGRVVGGTTDHVLVRPEVGDGGELGDTIAIRRDQIDDIDHHGNVAMVVFPWLGVPLVQLIPGTVTLMFSGEYTDFKGGKRDNAGGHIIGIFGFAFCLLPWALATKSGVEWWGSRSRASATDGALPPATPTVDLGPTGMIIRF